MRIMAGTFIAIALAVPSAAKTGASSSLAALDQKAVAGRSGENLSSTTASGAVTLNVDKELQDRRLSVRIVAVNRTDIAQPFGPRSISVEVDGKDVDLATLSELLGHPKSRGLRDSNLARASVAPTIQGFGSGSRPGQDASGPVVSNGMPDQDFATEDAVKESDQSRALKAALLGEESVSPHKSNSGAFFTEKVKSNARTMKINVIFAGEIHHFIISLR